MAWERKASPAITDLALARQWAEIGSHQLLTRLMLYGARNGGLPNLSQEECRKWLRC